MTETCTVGGVHPEFGRGYDHGIATAYRGQQQNIDSAVVLAIISLPSRLKAHRAARNLSLREIGRETGLSFSTLCRIEQGKDFAVSSLLAVAAYLDGARAEEAS